MSMAEYSSRYAESSNRHLIVDTKNNNAFGDELSNYFLSRQKRLSLSVSNKELELLDSLTAHPNFLEGRVSTYSTTYIPESNKYADKKTGKLINTPLKINTEYRQQLVIAHQNTIMPESHMFLLRVILAERIIETINQRLETIPQPYIGIHIRHTDYTSDYKNFFNSINLRNDLPIFLATDNTEVRDHMQKKYGIDRVFSFSRLPDEPLLPLHHSIPADLTIEKRNSQAIADLFMLACSKIMIAAPITNGYNGNKFSGYSKLAFAMFRSKSLLRFCAPKLRTSLALED